MLMLVQDLIPILQKMPQDIEVWHRGSAGVEPIGSNHVIVTVHNRTTGEERVVCILGTVSSLFETKD